jgi:superfamily II DNA or RNA helicase
VNGRYILSQLVALRADPRRQGPIIEVLPPVGAQPRYRVFHSPTEIREYDEDQLVPVESPPAAGGVVEALEAGRWLDLPTFRSRLVSARLSHALVDALYALHAARVRFVPFQFKPLLRLLRAERPRLLIADEVGVGKTIEAGLVLRELQARQEVGNVLIVCPKALVPKWKAELRRFDEDFRPLTPEALAYCLTEARLDGAWPAQYARAIVPLELMRLDQYLIGSEGRRRIPGLTTLTPPPVFDLLIVDEAHHLRTPGTHSWELARFLCDVSDAVLFLSATPVHLGSVNLFTLLNLLRPDVFLDRDVFEEVVEPNRHLTAAMQAIRAGGNDRARRAAGAALAQAAATPWGRRTLATDPRLTDWLPRLQAEGPLEDAERVRCLRDLEELHTLAHVMNRTRRRDIGRFTLREPRTVSVAFTPRQQRFYDELVRFRRDLLAQTHDPLVVRLITDTLERQAASCLPALLPTLERFLRAGRVSAAQITDDPEADEAEAGLPPGLRARAETLRALADALRTEADPKLAQLLAVAAAAAEEQGAGKLLLFSFFLHTLAYLERELVARGYRVGLVTGRVPDEQRERLRERFRLPRTDPDALDVLLSSEVGCEGLDYEFCDRLVNYDIPWNPMRVEQRIGRIDRFGQVSPKVLIYNFVTPETVEDRIFFRCFERLGVFRDTVGDLEEVLGDVTQELTRAALDPALTAEQAEQVARQTADNAVRLVEERRRLEDESADLLGMDAAFADEVLAIEQRGSQVTPEDLADLLARHLADPRYGGRLTAVERDPRLVTLRLPREGRTALAEDVRALGRTDRPTAELLQWLGGGESSLLLTLDQDAALERREVPFVTAVHPLVRVAVARDRAADEPLAARLVVTDASLPAGRYLFVCDLWETVALRPEVRLETFAWSVDADRPAPEVAGRVLHALSGASESVAAGLPADAVRRAVQSLEDEARQARLAALERVRRRNTALTATRLAGLESYHRHRLQRVEDELASTADARIRRMKTAERERILREREDRRREIAARQDADIVTQRVAAGLVEIRHAD